MAHDSAPSTREEALRTGFRYMNHGMLLMWRLGFGAFMGRRELSGQIMVLTHTGRVTGAIHRTPVNFAEYDGDLYCAAGFGRRSDWFRNLKAHPSAEVWVPTPRLGSPVGWWQAQAEEVTGQPDSAERLRDVLIASGFAGYLDGFRSSMPIEDVRALLPQYPVIRLHRTQALTGPGGPGDLAAAWPIATCALACGGVLTGIALHRARTAHHGGGVRATPEACS